MHFHKKYVVDNNEGGTHPRGFFYGFGVDKGYALKRTIFFLQNKNVMYARTHLKLKMLC